MADPLAIVGLISASVSLADRVHGYFSSFQDGPQHVAKLAAEVAAVGGFLGMLRTHLQQENSTGNNFDRASVLFFAVNGCSQQLKEIERKLRPKVLGSRRSHVIHRLKWPLEKEDTINAVAALNRYTQVFHFAVNLDGLTALQASQTVAFAQIQQRLVALPQRLAESDVMREQHRDILKIVQEFQNITEEVKQLRGRFDQVNFDGRMTILLDSLQSLPFQEKHRDIQMRRMEGLGQWLLNTPKFEEWREGLLWKNILWCHGAPGAGKTFLSSVVIDHLENRVEQAGGRLLYFYFDYKQQAEQTPFNILVSLLRQLLSTYSSIPNAASDLFKRIEKGQGLPGWKDLMTVFRNVCSGSSEEVFLVFDALDECDEKTHREPILDLVEFLSESTVRMLITSRPYPPDINGTLADYPEIVIEAADSDIRAFLLERITKSRRRSSRLIDETLREEIIQSITAKSQGMFLLPALQIDNILGRTNPDQVRQALRALPTGLVENLDLTIQRIKSQDSQDQPRADLAMHVLMWLSNVKRPLKVEELQHATATTPGKAQLVALTDPSFFTECCLGLVTIDTETSTVRLVHLSINEYLQDRAKMFFPRAHGELAITCLTYLSLDNLRNVKLSTKSDLNGLLSKFHFLDYAASNWGVHAAICFDAEVESMTLGFLNNRPLFELWNHLYEMKEADSSDSDISQYTVQDMSALHLSAIFGFEKLAQDALKDSNSDPNPRDSLGRSPLMLAAAYGQKTVLELLLSRKAIEINPTDSKGRTALSFAVHRGQIDVIRTFFSSANININIGNPFVAACEIAVENMSQATIQIVKLFLSRQDLDVNRPAAAIFSRFHSGELCAPWEWIAKTFDLESFQMLISRKGFDPSAYFTSTQINQKTLDIWNYMLNTDYMYEEWALNVVSIVHAIDLDPRFRLTEFGFLRFSMPFLYFALAAEGMTRRGSPGDYYYYPCGIWISDNASGTIRAKVRKRLEEQGFSFDTKDSRGRTYLHFAAQHDRSYEEGQEWVDFFLQHGTDVSAADNNGRTPLHYAAKAGLEEQAAILLEAGAVATAADNEGSTVLHFAVEGGNESIIRTLLNAGAAPSAADHDGWTVLHEAAWGGNASNAELLLNYGADVKAANKFGATALEIAARSKDSNPVVALLLDRGAEINPGNILCNSPLHEAAWNGSIGTCRILFQRGANPNIRSTTGTPLHTAAQWMRKEMIFAMISAGGDPTLLDSFGRGSFDWIAMHKSLADEMGTIMLMYRPTPPDVRRAHLLKCLRERIQILAAAEEFMRKEYQYRMGKQLLFLGDEESARIVLEDLLIKEIKPNVIELEDSCEQCYTDAGPFFYCKACPYAAFCSACLKDRKDDKMPWCKGHDFLKIPSDERMDLPKGVVNRQGQSYDDWFKDFQKKYCGDLITNGLHQDEG